MALDAPPGNARFDTPSPQIITATAKIITVLRDGVGGIISPGWDNLLSLYRPATVSGEIHHFFSQSGLELLQVLPGAMKAEQEGRGVRGLDAGLCFSAGFLERHIGLLSLKQVGNGYKKTGARPVQYRVDSGLGSCQCHTGF